MPHQPESTPTKAWTDEQIDYQVQRLIAAPVSKGFKQL